MIALNPQLREMNDFTINYGTMCRIIADYDLDVDALSPSG